jgi:hypothetical protein
MACQALRIICAKLVKEALQFVLRIARNVLNVTLLLAIGWLMTSRAP